jgi:type II secretion system protein N
MVRPRLDFALNLSRRQQLALKIGGFVLLSIFTFLFTLHLVFPYERLRGKLVEVLSDKYDVSIGKVRRGLLPGDIVFEKVILKTRPTASDEKPTEIVIDRLEIELGLDFNMIGLLRRKVAVDFAAELGDGEIEGELDWSRSMIEVVVSTDSLPLETVPGLASAVGLPMTGALNTNVTLRLPGGKWKDAEGRIEIDCNGCTIGDGVARLSMKPPQSRRGRTRASWDADASSLTVPRLSLGAAKALIQISKGVGEIKNFTAASGDGWLKITGRVEFKDPFASSLLPGCMQFKLSDELKQREPKFGNIEYGISEKLRQTDGSYSIPTTGKLTELRWDPSQRCGGGAAEDDDDEGFRPGIAGRPTLTPELPAAGDDRVDPATVPGVSGPEGDEIPVPGTAGPPLGIEAPEETAARLEPDGKPEPPAAEVVDRRGDRDDELDDDRDDRDPEDRDGRGPRPGDDDEDDFRGGVD